MEEKYQSLVSTLLWLRKKHNKLMEYGDPSFDDIVSASAILYMENNEVAEQEAA